MPGPGKLGHAEIRIGASRIMLSDEYPEMQFAAPRRAAARPCTCTST